MTPSEACMSRERLFEVISADFETGVLRWIPRDRSQFKSPQSFGMWTAKFAGKEVGEVIRNGYRRFLLDGQRLMNHRVIWCMATGSWPVFVIDHIDGNTCNNAIANLRDVEPVENRRNMRRFSTNRSGVTGVWASDGHWRAGIVVDGKSISCGSYNDFDAAVAARKDAEERFGFHPNHGRKAA